MGEIADEIADRMLDDLDGYEPWDDPCLDGPPIVNFIRKKPLICSHCGSEHLVWRKIKGRWVIFNMDGNVHTCEGFEPSIEILEEIARERKMEKMNEEQTVFGIDFENYTPPSWDEWFIKLMYLVAEKSKDTKTKIGALLVRDRRIISTGYNGMPVGVDDSIKERYDRPEKYNWFEHGERNAIYTAAKYGIPTNGTIMYTNGVPCIDCARAVIQAGVKEVIVHKPYEDMSASAARQRSDQSKWKGHNDVSLRMFSEAGVKVSVFQKLVGSHAYFNGKVFSV